MNKIPRHVLITGASGEIGGEIAKTLAAEGDHLYLCGYQHKERLRELSAELSDEYEILAEPRSLDLTDPSAADALFSGIPSLDVLILCAGITRFSLMQDTSAADWELVMDTNLTGNFHIIKRAIPLLLQSRNARILCISSVWGSHGAAMESAYSASKGGLDALTRSLARELAPSHIAVNAIACGVIDTEMNRSYLNPGEMDALREEIPAGRFGMPEEVAGFVRLLLDAPAYLTGQIIGFDGGWKV